MLGRPPRPEAEEGHRHRASVHVGHCVHRPVDAGSAGRRRRGQGADVHAPTPPERAAVHQVRLGPDQWNVTPSLEWVPKGAWADYSNSFRTEGYALLNLSGSVAVGPATELFADARNLLNRKAAGDISAVVNYATLTDAQRSIFYPVERRALFVGIRSRLGKQQ